MQKLNLVNLQKQFRDVLKLRDHKAAAVVDLINVNKDFSREQRLDVYQYAYLSRLVESMQEDFPLTQDLLGEKKFVRLTEGYLKKYPSSSWTLAELGLRFADFIGSAAGRSALAQLSASVNPEFVRDLAQTELQRVIVFLLMAPVAFNFTALAAVDPEVLLQSRLVVNSTVRLIKSKWPVDLTAIESRHRRKGFRHEAVANTFALFRSQAGVQIYKVPAEVLPVFTALVKGVAIGQLLEGVMKKKIEAQTVFTLFSEWAALGPIAGFNKIK